jgi:hypothetical protein
LVTVGRYMNGQKKDGLNTIDYLVPTG